MRPVADELDQDPPATRMPSSRAENKQSIRRSAGAAQSPAGDKDRQCPANFLRLLEDSCCRRTTAERGPLPNPSAGVGLRTGAREDLQGTGYYQLEGEEQAQSQAAVNQHVATLAEQRQAIDHSRTPGWTRQCRQQRHDRHGGVLVPDAHPDAFY